MTYIKSVIKEISINRKMMPFEFNLNKERVKKCITIELRYHKASRKYKLQYKITQSKQENKIIQNGYK